MGPVYKDQRRAILEGAKKGDIIRFVDGGDYIYFIVGGVRDGEVSGSIYRASNPGCINRWTLDELIQMDACMPSDWKQVN